MNTLILLTDIVEKIILLTLFGLSIWSVSIIIDRRKTLQSEANPEDLSELEKISGSQNFSEDLKKFENRSGIIFSSLNAANRSNYNSESMDRSFSGVVKSERARLEKGLSVLATLGSNAPFIGLFGTVLGIIRAFAYLGSQSGASSVMTGVSQALYATAMGLFVAIPATIGFNMFNQKIRSLVVKAESLKEILIAQRLREK